MSLNHFAKSSVRVLIVEDQGLMRALFERWVGGLPRFSVAGSARSGEEALLLMKESHPDVLMVDLQLPGMDGLEFVRAARQMRPQLRTLVVSSLVDPLALTRVLEAGVEGYIEKDASPEMLAQALETIAGGGESYSPTFRETLRREAVKPEAVGKVLSRREQQVLEFVLGKKSNREIAEAMGLSVRTVEFHRANVMAKLQASNAAELLTVAQLRGWK